MRRNLALGTLCAVVVGGGTWYVAFGQVSYSPQGQGAYRAIAPCGANGWRDSMGTGFLMVTQNNDVRFYNGNGWENLHLAGPPDHILESDGSWVVTRGQDAYGAHLGSSWAHASTTQPFDMIAGSKGNIAVGSSAARFVFVYSPSGWSQAAGTGSTILSLEGSD